MAVIVFDDHRFCAGRELDVQVMAAPHMHSQIELNFILEGHMDYRFEDMPVKKVGAGRLILFWGALPHQVIGKADVTRFSCIYMPVSTLLMTGVSDQLRSALFAGGVIEAKRILGSDIDCFLRWREDLMAPDPRMIGIVRDELSARIRRIDVDGWHDLKPNTGAKPLGKVTASGGLKVEQMARFIDEHAHEEIDVDAVAKAVNLHPNYAMALFKRSLGLTINQYLTRHRLDAAHAQLVSTQDDVASIAFDCGFGSLSRFYEAFRSRYGVSPAEFRRRQRRAA
jgi:AraC family transcriptional regulator, melibiose operon regulatory protein